MTSEKNSVEVSSSPVILTPADFADTGQWRLIIDVSAEGMGAVLRHVSDLTRPAVRVFSERWEFSKGKELLKRIENAVYEHPGILDDYATEIVVDTDKITFVPSDIVGTDEFPEESIYSTMFPGEEVITENLGEATVLCSLVNGFDGFMARTIPGARIRSHLGVMASFVKDTVSRDENFSVRVIFGDGKGYFFAFGEGRLICASEHALQSAEECLGIIADMDKVWGSDSAKKDISIITSDIESEPSVDFMESLTALNPRTSYFRLSREVAESGSPIAAAMLIFKEKPFAVNDLPVE